MKAAEHWDSAYAAGDSGKSWFQEHATLSQRLIEEGLAGIAQQAARRSVIDVGGGATTLTDDLLGAGFTDLTVLDVSSTGMDIARERLGERAESVTWICADLLEWEPSRVYGVWHDRAVLHFLTEESVRAAYRARLIAATGAGSIAVIGVFGPNGPTMCSALPVRRYSADDMGEFLGAEFEVAESFTRIHTTPSGGEQEFQWTLARRVS